MIMVRMSKIETAIALPIRQMVNPLQFAIGGVIALSGMALLLAQAASVA
jgi:hypothetical protein